MAAHVDETMVMTVMMTMVVNMLMLYVICRPNGWANLGFHGRPVLVADDQSRATATVAYETRPAAQGHLVDPYTYLNPP